MWTMPIVCARSSDAASPATHSTIGCRTLYLPFSYSFSFARALDSDKGRLLPGATGANDRHGRAADVIVRGDCTLTDAPRRIASADLMDLLFSETSGVVRLSRRMWRRRQAAL